jgi:hypothetical protein
MAQREAPLLMQASKGRREGGKEGRREGGKEGRREEEGHLPLTTKRMLSSAQILLSFVDLEPAFQRRDNGISQTWELPPLKQW